MSLCSVGSTIMSLGMNRVSKTTHKEWDSLVPQQPGTLAQLTLQHPLELVEFSEMLSGW